MKVVVLSMLCLVLAACNQSKLKAPAKQYPLTGKIVSIDLKEHTAMVDAEAIPNFMDAMKMDYPIASDSNLGSLKVGENIRAIVNMTDDGAYSLSNIRERPTSGAGK